MKVCVHCDQEVEPCSRCGHGLIHVETQFHSCTDKMHMAQEATDAKE